MLFYFDWDTNKARANLAKHEVSFRLATSVFRDALALTNFDEGHSDDEDRWVTLGRAQNWQVLVVVHTSEESIRMEMHIRIISARRADRQKCATMTAMTFMIGVPGKVVTSGQRRQTPGRKLGAESAALSDPRLDQQGGLMA